jgi:NitT/TauT family transport system substrate-binding protein
MSTLTTRGAFMAGSIAASATVIAARPARAQSGVLRILTAPVGVGALPFFAREKGYFDEVGLKVDLTPVTSGAAALAAVAGGAVEIGLTNAGSVAAAVLQKLPFTIIADGALFNAKRPDTLLCVAPNSPIAKAPDLNGKIVAVNGLKQAVQAGAQSWIDRNGGDSKTVRFVEMPFSTMAAAIESKRIDAGNIAEPAFTVAGHRVKAIASPEEAIAPVFSVIAFACDRVWVENNKTRAKSFKSAVERAAQWANENTREAKTMLAAYMQISPEVADAMTLSLYPTSLEVSHLQPLIDTMARYAFIPQRVDANTIITHF